MRVKTGITGKKKHKKLLAKTKGMRDMRSRSVKRAKEATLKAGVNAYKGRKGKKRDFRALWNIRINAAARSNETTYSKLISGLKKENIILDRKILAKLASDYPKIFSKITKEIK